MHPFRFIFLLCHCISTADALRLVPEDTFEALTSGGLGDTFAGAGAAKDGAAHSMVLSLQSDEAFLRFKEEFFKRVREAPKKTKKFLNTALLETGKVPHDGVWLKFGVDLSCDENHGGHCNKIGPLSHYRRGQNGTVPIFGFDWFQGLPENWRQGFGTGRFNRNGNIPKPPPGVEWVIGLYNTTLPLFFKKHDVKVSYLLVDSDLYSSGKYILDTTWPHLTKDAIVYFDEIMNYPGYESGEFLALYEFLSEKKLDYEVIMAATDANEYPIDREFDQQIAIRIF